MIFVICKENKDKKTNREKLRHILKLYIPEIERDMLPKFFLKKYDLYQIHVFSDLVIEF